MQITPPETIVVLDFETSGISPDHGARAIEIGALKLRAGQVVGRFQSLMNPGFRINSFIEDYTGITNRMLQEAPRPATIMRDFSGFIGNLPLVAHNAAFDRRFLDAEFSRIGRKRQQVFGCSMLAARRIYPESPDHKLATLVRYRNLRTEGLFHRALADAEMTAHLWLAMSEDLRVAYGFEAISFAMMHRLTHVPKAQVASFLMQQLSS